MNPHEDQLREAFESHEHLAPGLGEVYRGSQALYRRYRRRRTGSRVVGGAMLGAGLLAAGTNLPASLLPGGPAPVPTALVTVTALPPVTPSAVPTARVDDEVQHDLEAFESAGYDRDDARTLAHLWHSGADLNDIKAEAGHQLLAGQSLPIPPRQQVASTVPGSAQVTADDKALAAFFDSGHDWDDAVRLADLWHLADPADAKLKAGRLLAAGRRLPR